MRVDPGVGGTATIRMPEELDLGCAAELRAQLATVLREAPCRGTRRLVIDLRPVRFVDCAGWRLCLRVLRDAEAAGVPVELRHGSAVGLFRERIG